jgi:hypothetical protein
MNFFEETGFKIGLFFAGAVGSVVSFLRPQDLNWKQRVLTIFSGGMSSMYLTPIIISPIESIREMSQEWMLGAAFLVGYSGLKAIELSITKIKTFFNRK